MSRVDIRLPFLVYHAQRLAQSGDQRERRGEGGVGFADRRVGLGEIPEEARHAVGALDHRPGLGADADEPDPRRAHQRLLRGAEQDVDMPVVLPRLDAAEPAYRIDDKKGGAVLDDLADRREVGDRPGGALAVDDADGAVVVLGEAALDSGGDGRLAPLWPAARQPRPPATRDRPLYVA